MSDVELLLAAGIDRNRAERLARPGNVFIDILQSTSGATLRWISDEDAREIDDAVRQHSTGAPPMSPPPMPLDPEDLAAEQQRVMRLIEQRANQGPFRDAVMARDGRRCVVTAYRTAEVLEAAHLIPYASGHPARDNPNNGILLRADIHLLMDRRLLAIDPRTMRVWISAELQSSVYGRLHNKEIRTEAGREYLQYHYICARGAST